MPTREHEYLLTVSTFERCQRANGHPTPCARSPGARLHRTTRSTRRHRRAASQRSHAHQPALPILDREAQSPPRARYAARNPTPGFLDVRMAVEEERHVRGFQLSQRVPARLFGTLKRREESRPVPLLLAQIIHDPGDAQPLRPDRAGVRGPETIRPEGWPASAPPSPRYKGGRPRKPDASQLPNTHVAPTRSSVFNAGTSPISPSASTCDAPRASASASTRFSRSPRP